MSEGGRCRPLRPRHIHGQTAVSAGGSETTGGCARVRNPSGGRAGGKRPGGSTCPSTSGSCGKGRGVGNGGDFRVSPGQGRAPAEQTRPGAPTAVLQLRCWHRAWAPGHGALGFQNANHPLWREGGAGHCPHQDVQSRTDYSPSLQISAPFLAHRLKWHQHVGAVGTSLKTRPGETYSELSCNPRTHSTGWGRASPSYGCSSLRI